MSLGGGASTTLQNAVANAWKNGAANGSVLVAAAGNDGNSAVNYPAGYAQVISVAATDHNDAKASFSNANADVEVAAPGVAVLSTRARWRLRRVRRHVDGHPARVRRRGRAVAAQRRSDGPGIRGLLTSRVDDLGAAGRDTSFGFGRVNLCKAAGALGG